MMLEVRHLKRIYKVKNAEPVYALNDVSLKFPETGLVFILGKSGSGKSTLLNVMGGLDFVDDGEIIINGKSSKEFTGSEMDSYRNTYLGFIFQEYNILNDFTVGENIGLALQLQHKKATPEEVEKILAEVDLAGYSKRKPNELSGGQKQRVAIARALVKEPKIIFGDEPTGALDSNTGKQVFETLKKLSKDKLVVIVSHDRDFAEHFGDRVIELKDGKVISDISKTTVSSEKPREGLSLIGDNVIRIDKNHPLTVDDLEIINATLAKSDSEAFITMDDHVNDAICEAARIDKSGNREEFVTTDPEKIKEGEGSFEAIPSKFTLGNAFKMGGKSMRVKPFRLGMTILLSAVAFTLFGSAATLGMFNSVDATVSVSQKNDITALTMSANTKTAKNRSTSGFSDEMIQEIESSTGAKTFKVNDIYGNFDVVRKSNDYYHLSDFRGGVTINQSGMDVLGFDLVAGSLPKKTNECAITLYQYNTFKDLGYGNKNGNPEIASKDVTYETIIGKKLNYYGSGMRNNYEYLTITGIVDTHLPQIYEKFRTAEDINRSDSDYQALQQLQYSESIHTLVYLGNEKVVGEGDTTNDIQINSYLELSFNTLNGDEDYSSCNLGYYESHKDQIFFDKTKQSLEDGEILVSAEYFSKYMQMTKEYEPFTPFKVTFDGAFTSYDGTYPYETTYTSYQQFFDYEIPNAARYKTIYDDFEKFFENDFEEFKAINEGLKKDIYGDYDFGYEKDGSGNYDYTKLENPSTDEEVRNAKIEKYNIFQHYCDYRLGEGAQSPETTSVYYQDMQKNIQDYTDYYKTQYSMTQQELLDTLGNIHYNALYEYCQKNYEAFFNQYGDDSSVLERVEGYTNKGQKTLTDSMKRDIMFDVINSGGYYEPFSSEAHQYEKKKTKELISKVGSMDSFSLKLSGKLTGYYDDDGNMNENKYEKKMKVVGLDLDLTSTDIAISKADAEYIQVEDSKGNYYLGSSYLLVAFGRNKMNQKKFFKFFYDKAKLANGDWNKVAVGTWSMHCQDNKISEVYYLSNTLQTMMRVFIYVGIALAIFSMFLFYNFMSISINNKKREIGILRAVGAKRMDVFKIFYSESFIIASINFILATIATIVVSILVNNLMATKAGFDFTIMNPGILVVLLLLALSYFASFISALLPVIKIANKKPIDAIQNR